MKNIYSQPVQKNKVAKALCLTALICFVSIHVFAQENKYRVTAYKKGDEKTTSVSNIVEIIPAISIYIPNAFTPNGDNLNDTFGAVGEGITEYKMQIFNRWGILVFETENINEQWDGTYQGTLSQQDSYVYKITAKGENSSRINKTGNVTLLQ